MQTVTVALLIGLAGHASVVRAQVPATPPGQPALTPAGPSLDELLGLKGSAPPAEDPWRGELARRLGVKESEGEDFERAVAVMSDAAARLTSARDAGLGTLRLQEEAVMLLDRLIAQAQQNQQQQSSSSSSSQQQNQQQQSEQQAGQQQSQQQQAQASAQSRSNEGQGEVAGQSAEPKPPEAGSAATWGNLPEHIRQALTQGLSDKFSTLYQSMTEAYYKRLAEDPSRAGAAPPTRSRGAEPGAKPGAKPGDRPGDRP